MKLVKNDQSVTLCCSVKGADLSPTCILTLFGKPMMLLEGNGFIKVLTPMKAAVRSQVDIYKLLCLKNVHF